MPQQLDQDVVRLIQMATTGAVASQRAQHEPTIGDAILSRLGKIDYDLQTLLERLDHLIRVLRPPAAASLDDSAYPLAEPDQPPRGMDDDAKGTKKGRP